MDQGDGEREGEPVPLKAVTLTEARDTLGALANRVEFVQERIVITRWGKPAFALVPLKDLPPTVKVA